MPQDFAERTATTLASLEAVLEKLAGNNATAQKRIKTDAFRIWSNGMRQRGRALVHPKRADAKTGRDKLALITRHAEKLATAIEEMAPNLQVAWPEGWEAANEDAALVRALIEKVKIARKHFEPREKARNWQAERVNELAFKIFSEYTGRKDLRSVSWLTGKTSGLYYRFLGEVFKALNIDASPDYVIRTMQERAKTPAKKPQK